MNAPSSVGGGGGGGRREFEWRAEGQTCAIFDFWILIFGGRSTSFGGKRTDGKISDFGPPARTSLPSVHHAWPSIDHQPCHEGTICHHLWQWCNVPWQQIVWNGSHSLDLQLDRQ
jgi:hypothetical protein